MAAEFKGAKLSELRKALDQQSGDPVVLININGQWHPVLAYCGPTGDHRNARNAVELKYGVAAPLTDRSGE